MSDDGYRRLDVYNLAHDLAVRIHKMTLTLPALERYEEAAQVRRSSKRVSASIVEGYAQRKFKAQFLVYLYRGLGSADETQEHLRFLMETGSLASAKEGRTLLKDAEDVSRKLARFIQGVEREHRAPGARPFSPEDFVDPEDDPSDPTSDIRHPTSKG